MANVQTPLIISCFVILVYIASVLTYSVVFIGSKNPFDQSLELDSERYNQIATGTNYIYQTDVGKSTQPFCLMDWILVKINFYYSMILHHLQVKVM